MFSEAHWLAGMRERVAVFGGELRAGPRRGGGFAVQARLPLGEGLRPDGVS
jgi:signal transduction histidine kinase